MPKTKNKVDLEALKKSKADKKKIVYSDKIVKK